MLLALITEDMHAGVGRLTVDGLVESMMACRQGWPRDRQLFQAVLNVIYEEFQFLPTFRTRSCR